MADWSAALHSPRTWLSAMTAVGVIGGWLAITHAAESDWWTHRSLSRLGVDAGASGFLNATLVVLGLILVALAISLNGTLASLSSAGRLSSKARWRLRAGLVAAGVAVVLSGVFRNEGQLPHLIHNLAGFGAPALLVSTLIGGRWAVGDLGCRFDRESIAILVVCVGLFTAAYGGHLIPYAVMELACFGLIGSWLWLFEARLQGIVGQP